MINPLVSVIIVSYNTCELTLKSIKSVFSSRGFKKGEIEVIIVDNNSSDNTVESIGKHFKQFRLIVNPENLGFGAGNNQGAGIASGKYLLLLNSDAFLEKDSLRTMVDIMEKRKEIISVGPQLRYVDGSMQQSCGYLPTPLRVTAWMWWLDKIPLVKNLFKEPYHVFDLNWYKKDRYPEWLMGACIMFRKEEFQSAGGFDDKIFMYAEEVELYNRLKEIFNKKVLFTAKAKVIHTGRASSDKANAYVLMHELKGIQYIYQKHSPNLLWLIRFVILVGVILRIIVFGLIPSRRESVSEYKKFFAKSK